jgi:hypothetical protein
LGWSRSIRSCTIGCRTTPSTTSCRFQRPFARASALRDRIAADVGQAAQDPALASRLANVGLIVTAVTTNELAVAMAEQRTQVDNVASILGLHRPGREGGLDRCVFCGREPTVALPEDPDDLGPIIAFIA